MMTKRNNVRITISNLMYNRVIVIVPNQVCKRMEQYQRHKRAHIASATNIRQALQKRMLKKVSSKNGAVKLGVHMQMPLAGV